VPTVLHVVVTDWPT